MKNKSETPQHVSNYNFMNLLIGTNDSKRKSTLNHLRDGKYCAEEYFQIVKSYFYSMKGDYNVQLLVKNHEDKMFNNLVL